MRIPRQWVVVFIILSTVLGGSIILRDLWLQPDMKSMPGHFALLAGVMLAGALMALYRRRWKRFEAIGLLVLDVGILVCGIGTWFTGEHVLGLLFSILGGSDAFVQIRKIVKNRAFVAGGEESLLKPQ